MDLFGVPAVDGVAAMQRHLQEQDYARCHGFLFPGWRTRTDGDG
jgi:hypothetical protein